MGKATELLKCIKSFKDWEEIGGSRTQGSATKSEDFVENCISQIYHSAKVYKMGSQRHPDFIIVPKEVVESIENFRRAGTNKKRKMSTHQFFDEWENSNFNSKKIRLVRIEVKTGKTVYTLNDTFPNPRKDLDEIYVLFSISEKSVYVTTSFTMAEKCKCQPSIVARFNKSTQTIKDFHGTLKKIWDGIGITTAARPTYTMNKDYAHHEANAERISEIFLKAGIAN